jgi:hypothetical protein
VGRRVFIASSVVSLLLAVAVAGLWARSYFVADSISVCDGHATALVDSTVGSIRSEIHFDESANWSGGAHIGEEVPSVGKDPLSSLAEFEFYAGKVGLDTCWLFAVPHWALLALCLMLPTIATVGRHLRRRRAPACFPIEPPTSSSPAAARRP